jgi:hypothetical protein
MTLDQLSSLSLTQDFRCAIKCILVFHIISGQLKLQVKHSFQTPKSATFVHLALILGIPRTTNGSCKHIHPEPLNQANSVKSNILVRSLACPSLASKCSKVTRGVASTGDIYLEMAFANVVERDAGIETRWGSQSVIAHTKTEGSAASRLDRAANPCTTSGAKQVGRPVCGVD